MSALLIGGIKLAAASAFALEILAFPQPTAVPTNELTCRVLSSVRADKVGGGFFMYTAPKPEVVSGVVLMVELAYPPSLTSLSSVGFALRYAGVAGEETATSIGFDSLPNKDDVLDQDITWILHATSSYEIPLEDPGFDGKAGSEQMRLLFEAPNQVDRATLLYRGRACGDSVSIPSRKQ